MTYNEVECLVDEEEANQSSSMVFGLIVIGRNNDGKMDTYRLFSVTLKAPKMVRRCKGICRDKNSFSSWLGLSDWLKFCLKGIDS